ncbi:MAG: heat shock protein Hsp20 [Gemmatimonadetes bacterium]|nr:heat shock protein Hsp20 [Gemmatimonadota bacterium]
MTRQQQTPSGANEPNPQSAGASAAGSSTTGATSAGTSSSSGGGATPRSTSDGNTGAGASGTSGTSGAGTESRGNRESQSDTRETERSIPRTQEGMQRQRSDESGRQTSRRSRTTGLARLGLPPSPWELMRRMTEDLSRAAESLREVRSGASSRSQRSSSMVPANAGDTSTDLADLTSWVPDVEVLRQPDNFLVRVDLPGVAPDEIDISIDDGLLTIAGERTQERREADDGVVRTERTYGGFLRTIVLPEGADESRIEARVDNGVLEINVPISGENRSRRIAVQGSDANRS